jgi:hypothetical protein
MRPKKRSKKTLLRPAAWCFSLFVVVTHWLAWGYELFVIDANGIRIEVDGLWLPPSIGLTLWISLRRTARTTVGAHLIAGARAGVTALTVGITILLVCGPVARGSEFWMLGVVGVGIYSLVGGGLSCLCAVLLQLATSWFHVPRRRWRPALLAFPVAYAFLLAWGTALLIGGESTWVTNMLAGFKVNLRGSISTLLLILAAPGEFSIYWLALTGLHPKYRHSPQKQSARSKQERVASEAVASIETTASVITPPYPISTRPQPTGKDLDVLLPKCVGEFVRDIREAKPDPYKMIQVDYTSSGGDIYMQFGISRSLADLPERNPLRNNTLFSYRRNTFPAHVLSISRPFRSSAIERNPLRNPTPQLITPQSKFEFRPLKHDGPLRNRETVGL